MFVLSHSLSGNLIGNIRASLFPVYGNGFYVEQTFETTGDRVELTYDFRIWYHHIYGQILWISTISFEEY